MNRWTYQTAQDQGLPPAEKLRSVRREPGLPSVLLNQASGMLSALALRLVHRLRIDGRDNLPAHGPFVMAANHCSHLDALCLSAALPVRLRHEAFPVAAGDTFFDTPAHATAAALMMNAIPMWRRRAGRHALEDLRHKLTATGCILLLFPEGTRSRDGRMGTCKPGLGMLVAGTEVPVMPCHIAGTFEALPPGRRRPKRLPLSVSIGPALHFQKVPNSREGWDVVSQAVEQAIRRLGPNGDKSIDPARNRDVQ